MTLFKKILDTFLVFSWDRQLLAQNVNSLCEIRYCEINVQMPTTEPPVSIYSNFDSRFKVSVIKLIVKVNIKNWIQIINTVFKKK